MQKLSIFKNISARLTYMINMEAHVSLFLFNTATHGR